MSSQQTLHKAELGEIGVVSRGFGSASRSVRRARCAGRLKRSYVALGWRAAATRSDVAPEFADNRAGRAGAPGSPTMREGCRMSRTLIVTNDFPPRQGGIETFVHAMASRFPSDGVVIHTSAEPGATAHDARLPFPVVRDTARMLVPTPRAASRAAAIARRHGCDRVWFGAAALLGLMAGRLRRETAVVRTVATTHGHEVWWARTPAARSLLRRIGAQNDAVTYLGESTRAPIAAALGSRAASRMARLARRRHHGVPAGARPPSGA